MKGAARGRPFLFPTTRFERLKARECAAASPRGSFNASGPQGLVTRRVWSRNRVDTPHRKSIVVRTRVTHAPPTPSHSRIGPTPYWRSIRGS